MDISHQKFTNTNWEPYNTPMEDHHHHLLHHQTPFDHPTHNNQWPNYNNYLPFPNSNPSSSPQVLLPSPTLLGFDQSSETFKENEDPDHHENEHEDEEELGAMKEMMFKIAAMQPVDIDPATIRKPRRRNVRISDDPQSVAARHRRERISEKIRILQRLVPGGTKMDTASMLDEAIRYVKFLKKQIRVLQANHHHQPPPCLGILAAAVGGGDGAGTSSYLFGGNNGDGAVAGDDPMCFNRKFIAGD